MFPALTALVKAIRTKATGATGPVEIDPIGKTYQTSVMADEPVFLYLAAEENRIEYNVANATANGTNNGTVSTDAYACKSLAEGGVYSNLAAAYFDCTQTTGRPYVQIPHDTDFNVGTALSFECLFKAANLGSPSYLFSSSEWSSPTSLYAVSVTPTGFNVAVWSGGTEYTVTGLTTTILVDTLYHLVITIDNSSTTGAVNLYLNDSLVATSALPSITIPTTKDATTGYIGAVRDTEGSAGLDGFYFNGVISHVAQYDYLLTPTQVAQHYSQIDKETVRATPADIGIGAEILLDTPNAYYRLNSIEQGSTTGGFEDNSGNANNGTAFGEIQQGVIGLGSAATAVMFLPNSTTQAGIKIPYSATLQTTSAMTIMGSAVLLTDVSDSPNNTLESAIIFRNGDSINGNRNFGVAFLVSTTSMRITYRDDLDALQSIQVTFSTEAVADSELLIAYHYAVTINNVASGDVNFYRNGSLIGTASLTDAIRTTTTSPASYIGAPSDVVTNGSFCILDDVAYLTSILTPERIAGIASKVGGFTCSDLDSYIARWSGDDIGPENFIDDVDIWWEFTSNTNATLDSRGVSTAGVGSLSYVASPNGTAVRLELANRELIRISAGNIQYQEFSIKITFRIPTLGGSQTLISSKESGSGDYTGYHLYVASSGAMVWVCNYGDGSSNLNRDVISSASGTVTANTWHTVIASRSSSAMFLSVDDVTLEELSTVKRGTIDYTGCQDAIGARYTSGSITSDLSYTNFLDGDIDDIRIIDRYTGDISLRNNQRLDNKTPSAVVEGEALNAVFNAGGTPITFYDAYWPLDSTNATGTTVSDLSGNGYDLDATIASYTTSGAFAPYDDLYEHGTGAGYTIRFTTAIPAVIASRSFSVSIWTRHNGYADNRDQAVVSYSTSSGGRSGWVLGLNSTNNLWARTYNNGTIVGEITSTEQFNVTDQLTQLDGLIFTRDDATDTIYLYLRGGLIGSDVESSPMELQGTEHFRIGGLANSSGGAVTEDYDGRSQAVGFYGSYSDLDRVNAIYFKKELPSTPNAVTDIRREGYDGVTNGGYYFNGTDTVAILNATLTSLRPTGSMTVTGWIRKLPGSTADRVVVISNHNNSNDAVGYDGQAGFILDSQRFVCGNNTGYTTGTNRAIAGIVGEGGDIFNDNQWHHIAGVYENPVEARHYIDGILNATSTYTGGIAYPTYTEAYIGAWATDNDNNADSDDLTLNTREGEVDDVRLYNIALSDSALAYLVKTTIPPKPQDMISEWKFESNANDSVGGRNLTTIGAPTYPTGWEGNAINFDGVDDCLELSTANSTAFALQTFSVSCWILDEGSHPVTFGHVVGNYYFQNAPQNISDGWRIRVNNDSGSIIYDEYDTYVDSPPSGYRSVVSNTSKRGIWEHVVVVRTPTNIKVYIDGELESDITTGISPIGYNANNKFTVGASEYRDNPKYRFYNGSVDEVRVYNRVLTQAEIKTIGIRDEPEITPGTGNPPTTPALDVTVDVTDVTATIVNGAYTTPTLTATVSGGIGPFTYAWTSDGAKLTADTPTAIATTYSGTGTSESTTETLTITVTDTGDSNNTATFDVTTNITWYLGVSVSLDVTTIDVDVPNGAYKTVTVTATAVNGVGPNYSFEWNRISGTNLFTSPAQVTGTSLTYAGDFNGNGADQEASELWRVTVTDDIGGTDTADLQLDVTFGTPAVLSAFASPTNLIEYTQSAPYTTAAVTTTASGGVGPYTYAWARLSGDTVMAADAATAATTTFTGTGSNETANETWRCTVTDSSPAPQNATADVTLAIQFSDPPTALTVDADSIPNVSGPNGILQSEVCGVTVSGGTPPYTYVWDTVSFSGQFTQVPPEPRTPFSEFTTFRGLCINTSGQVTYSITVTDSTPGTPLVGSDNTTVGWYSY